MNYAIKGNMSSQQLTTNMLITHAENYHKNTEIISYNVRGEEKISNWSTFGKRSKKIAYALLQNGYKEGDIIGTICPNTIAHMELIYAISGFGGIAHTINPRLFPEEIVYIVNHAENKAIFVDSSYLAILISHKHLFTSVENIYIVGPKHNEMAAKMNGFKFVEDLMDHDEKDFTWPEINEESAAVLCYTSGTTGNPKGVLYSHKSIVLHANMICLPDYLSLSSRDCILPITPMFHVNAWGVTYASSMVGAKLVLPGSNVSAKNLIELINKHDVSISIAIPTIWEEVLEYLKVHDIKIPSLKRVYSGGSQVPQWMIQEFKDKHNIDCVQVWGMTETSPLGLVNYRSNNLKNKKNNLMTKTGRPVWAMEFKITDPKGDSIKKDHTQVGNIWVKGPTVINKYYKEKDFCVDSEGWFDTGDIGNLDEDGYISLTDRSKDLIKSGGEWISSIQLEQIIRRHPKVYDASVIGIKDKKWGERPLVVAEIEKNANASEVEILDYFKDKIAKWQIPDKVIFIDELPLSSTGKPLKNKLRDKYFDQFVKEE